MLGNDAVGECLDMVGTVHVELNGNHVLSASDGALESVEPAPCNDDLVALIVQPVRQRLSNP